MKMKKLMSLGIAMVLTLSMMLTGCSGNDKKNDEEGIEQTAEKEGTEETAELADEDQSQTESNVLAEELMKKYTAGAGDYDGNVIKVNRDEALQIELGYNPWDMDADIYESFVIYQDADLQFPVEAGSYEYDAETGILTIEPPFYGIAEMDSSELDLTHLNGNYISDDEENGWGTLAQYYLAANVDVKTGKALSKPLITVIKVNAELSVTPQLVFDPTEDGYARFTWQEVPGAEGYLLFKINKDEEGLWEYTYVFADVAGTEWNSKEEDHQYEGRVLSMNSRFRQYYTSDDSELWIEENAEELLEFSTEVSYDEYFSEYFGVIAYNAEGCSSMSNLYSAKDLAHMLPTEQASYANEESFFDVSGTLDLPAAMSVTLCDGTTAQKVIDYDFDSIVKNEDNNTYTIVAKGCQTSFTQEILVCDVNWDTLEGDLAEVKDRQEKLKNKGGVVSPSLTVEEDSKEKTEPAEEPKASAEPEKTEEPAKSAEPENIQVSEVPVTSNSAMSEYMALHMLETKDAIDLSAFPESADTEKVVDAFFEAQYQNPMILGVRGGSIDTEKRILYVEYDFDKETTAQKQDEIQQKVDEIVAEIITDDMNDSEKGIAINTYLCENAVYDDAALENAEQYSFTQVDEEFYDSFTAYGILVDGVGVCASYSAAYKLLADAAGLESIVVTGYLDGSVPHAWNKVKLNGDWYIVDATNNDNDVIENALLNLSDGAAGTTLVEDNRFAMDGSISTYAAGKEEEEYYHATDRYFEIEEISDELASLLAEEGKAVLRTEYDIDDATFYEIAQEAANKSGKNISGFYWMGVIHLEE